MALKFMSRPLYQLCVHKLVVGSASNPRTNRSGWTELQAIAYFVVVCCCFFFSYAKCFREQNLGKMQWWQIEIGVFFWQVMNWLNSSDKYNCYCYFDFKLYLVSLPAMLIMTSKTCPRVNFRNSFKDELSLKKKPLTSK